MGLFKSIFEKHPKCPSMPKKDGKPVPKPWMEIEDHLHYMVENHHGELVKMPVSVIEAADPCVKSPVYHPLMKYLSPSTNYHFRNQGASYSCNDKLGDDELYFFKTLQSNLDEYQVSFDSIRGQVCWIFTYMMELDRHPGHYVPGLADDGIHYNWDLTYYETHAMDDIRVNVTRKGILIEEPKEHVRIRALYDEEKHKYTKLELFLSDEEFLADLGMDVSCKIDWAAYYDALIQKANQVTDATAMYPEWVDEDLPLIKFMMHPYISYLGVGKKLSIPMGNLLSILQDECEYQNREPGYEDNMIRWYQYKDYGWKQKQKACGGTKAQGDNIDWDGVALRSEYEGIARDRLRENKAWVSNVEANVNEMLFYIYENNNIKIHRNPHNKGADHGYIAEITGDERVRILNSYRYADAVRQKLNPGSSPLKVSSELKQQIAAAECYNLEKDKKNYHHDDPEKVRRSDAKKCAEEKAKFLIEEAEKYRNSGTYKISNGGFDQAVADGVITSKQDLRNEFREHGFTEEDFYNRDKIISTAIALHPELEFYLKTECAVGEWLERQGGNLKEIQEDALVDPVYKELLDNIVYGE